MPKVKIKRHSPKLDMAPMCDVAFLLLTFFILTSNFIQKEVVQINTPSSISEIKIPETNIIMIFVDNEGKVFFGMDGQKERALALKGMGDKYGITFTPEELGKFSLVSNFGVPMANMKQYLSLEQAERDAMVIGIPVDSTNNQIKDWVKQARMAKKQVQVDAFVAEPVKSKIAIKGDAGCPYPIIRDLMNTLQDINESRYNLITGLEQNPEKLNIN